MYEGEWKDDLREGIGFEKFENGNIYKGDFAFGKAQGRGIFVWRNGEVYEGEFYEGLKEGFGTWKCPNEGPTYVGEWKRS